MVRATLTEFLTKVPKTQLVIVTWKAMMAFRKKRTFDDILDCEITEQEVRNAIRHLKAGKSAGPDCILAEMLKVAEPVIVPYLKNVFNVLFDRGYVPGGNGPKQ